MPSCRILRLYPLRTLGMNPRNESADRTLVPPSTVSRWNTWDAWIPNADARPSDLSGRSTLARVETERCRSELPPETP